MAVKRIPVPSQDFETQKLMKLSEPELRAEYTRLRSIANKRLATFAKSEFTESETYRYNKDRYKKLVDINNKSELVSLLIDAKRFTSGDRGTVTGQRRIRKEYIETMRQEHGYDWLNSENYSDWLDFLQFVKSKVGYAYETSELGEMFDKAKSDPESGIDKAEAAKQAFERYQEEHTIE